MGCVYLDVLTGYWVGCVFSNVVTWHIATLAPVFFLCCTNLRVQLLFWEYSGSNTCVVFWTIFVICVSNLNYFASFYPWMFVQDKVEHIVAIFRDFCRRCTRARVYSQYWKFLRGSVFGRHVIFCVNGSISVLSRSFEGLKFMLLIESKKQYAAPRYAGYYILAQLQVFLNLPQYWLG